MPIAPLGGAIYGALGVLEIIGTDVDAVGDIKI